MEAFINNFITENKLLSAVIFTTLSLWSLFFKGLALYRSANDKDIKWFIPIMIINTVGLLEIAYLFYFAKNKLTLGDLKSDLLQIKQFTLKLLNKPTINK